MIIFPHIPKTAGTHFKQILQRVYQPDEIIYEAGDPAGPTSPISIDPVAWRREANEFTRNLPTTAKIIVGHFSVAKYFDLLGAADLMTWVRHPVARLISNYFYLKNHVAPVGSESIFLDAAKSVSFAEFAEIPVMQNIMTRVYLHTARFEDFAFIGIQEHYADDLRYLRELLDWPPIEFSATRINASSFPGYQDAVRQIMSDRDLVSRIERMNRADLEFYEDAVEMRRKRLRKKTSWISLLRKRAAA